MSEPTPGTPNVATSGKIDPSADQRAVRVTLSPEWARAIGRLQQLHNEGHTAIKMSDDAQGHVQVEPG
jgi:hypothetical protein